MLGTGYACRVQISEIEPKIIEKTTYDFYILHIVDSLMALKLRCEEYGFECDFTLEGAESIELLEQLKTHFEEEHGIEYPIDAVIQMIQNRGYSLSSIKK